MCELSPGDAFCPLSLRGCVQVSWNGYSSSFMCFMQWSGAKGCFRASEPKGSGHRCCDTMSALCHLVWHLHGPRYLWIQVKTTRFPAGLLVQQQPCTALLFHLNSSWGAFVGAWHSCWQSCSPCRHVDLIDDISLTTRKSAMKGNSFFSLTKSIYIQILCDSLYCCLSGSLTSPRLHPFGLILSCDSKPS